MPTTTRPPRPFGPHPVERQSVSIPVRNSDGGFAWVKIDPDNYKVGMAHRWRLDADGYAVTHVYDVEKKRATHLMLHRVVSRAPAGVLCDHIHHNLLDCRRRALRWSNSSQNAANARRFGRHSSKYRGVTRNGARWQAQCKHGPRNFYLGLFVSEEAAAAAYNAKATEFFGKFAILNRLPVAARKAA